MNYTAEVAHKLLTEEQFKALHGSTAHARMLQNRVNFGINAKPGEWQEVRQIRPWAVQRTRTWLIDHAMNLVYMNETPNSTYTFAVIYFLSSVDATNFRLNYHGVKHDD